MLIASVSVGDSLLTLVRATSTEKVGGEYPVTYRLTHTDLVTDTNITIEYGDLENDAMRAFAAWIACDAPDLTTDAALLRDTPMHKAMC